MAFWGKIGPGSQGKGGKGKSEEKGKGKGGLEWVWNGLEPGVINVAGKWWEPGIFDNKSSSQAALAREHVP